MSTSDSKSRFAIDIPEILYSFLSVNFFPLHPEQQQTSHHIYALVDPEDRGEFCREQGRDRNLRMKKLSA